MLFLKKCGFQVDKQESKIRNSRNTLSRKKAIGGTINVVINL